jgi:hypothetical protein
VSAEVSADVLVRSTEVGFRLHVGEPAPVGAVVIAQVSETVPVNEFVGDTVIVALPVEPEVMGLVVVLVRAKPAFVFAGACQKSPQPATSGAAASNNRTHPPTFIATPRAPLFGCAVLLEPVIRVSLVSASCL